MPSDLGVTVAKSGAKFLDFIPIVGPILSSGLQFLFDSIAAKRQRKFAQDAWNQQATYNSPVAQMQRYRAAGMNPAYGSANFNATAPTFQNGITAVAAPNAPDFIAAMSHYQDIRNKSVQERSMSQEVENRRLQNYILNNILPERIDTEKMKAKQSAMNYDLSAVKLVNDRNLGYLSQLLKRQELDFKSASNPIQVRLLELMRDLQESGLNSSDSAFLRVLSRKFQGNKEASTLFPYVIGDRAANFLGDLIKIGIPSGAISKFWQNTKPVK